MPLRTFSLPTYSFCTDSMMINAACWTLLAGEDLDLGHHPEIKYLYVSCYTPGICMHSSLKSKSDRAYSLLDPRRLCRTSAEFFRCGPRCMMTEDDLEAGPLTVPSIANHFPNLSCLVFRNWDDSMCFIGKITDVPSSLREIRFHNTCLYDLTPVLTFGTRLYSFVMDQNHSPLRISSPFNRVTSAIQFSQVTIVDSLYFNSSILDFHAINCVTSLIYGLGDNMGADITYFRFTHCITPYDPAIIENEHTPNDAKLTHISRINALETYREIGSIQKRIIDPFSHRDEPIVAAIFLASNVPRRMLEFVGPDMYYPKSVEQQQPDENNADNVDDYDDLYDY